MTPRTLASASLLIPAVAACSLLAPGEPAPLQGGETITYRTYVSASAATAILTFTKKGSGFVISSNSPGFPPEEVSANLRRGRSRLGVYALDILWLPPSERKLGAKNHVGEVIEKSSINGRSTFVLSERNGAVRRHFDAATGFLVQTRRPGSLINSTDLVSSTIPGL